MVDVSPSIAVRFRLRRVFRCVSYECLHRAEHVGTFAKGGDRTRGVALVAINGP